jgi:uncharacterized protein
MGDIQSEPSMEEILASIKRVIAEDSRADTSGRAARRPARPAAAAPAASAEDAETSDEDVLELDDPVSEEGGLVSPDAAAASRQKLAALTALRADPAPAASPADVAPLEAVVRDMLRPMLKDWLDRNLPEIVEQLVAREVARITGKPL